MNNSTSRDTNHTSTLKPDLGHAEHFLKLLDESAEWFVFQTFDDLKCRKAKEFSQIYHGTLEQYIKELTNLNSAGAGIFIAAQEMDGKGRKNENVVRIRCVFQEDDGQGKPLPLEPHIEVQTSPGKHHRYLLVDELSVEDFRAVQECLIANYGSDPNAKDPARVLRLPGFFHVKDPCNPHMVRIISESGTKPYSRSEIFTAFPPVIKQKGNSHDAGASSNITPDEMRKIRSALAYIPSDDRHLWITVGMELKTLGDVGRGLWLEWSQTSVKFDPEDAARTWNSFKPEFTGYGNVFNIALKHGWVAPSEHGKDDVWHEEDTPYRSNGKGKELTPVCVSAASVHRKSIEWLWKDRIALGMLSLLYGDPGVGKSFVTLSLVANVSRGRDWPIENTPCPPGGALIVSAEDSAEHTVVPRLKALGADLSRIELLTSVKDNGKERPFYLTDVKPLEHAIEGMKDCRLVVIDPVSAFFGASTDSHKNTDVRSVLAPLSEIAVRMNVAIVCVTHMNKNMQCDNPLYRATGSLAFIAASRTAHLIVNSKDSPNCKLMFLAKSNIGPRISGALSYSVITDQDGLANIAWNGHADINIGDVLGQSRKGGSNRQKLNDACEWLRGVLSGPGVVEKEIEEMADQAGFSWGTVRRAKALVGAVAKKGGMNGGWYWVLGHSTPPEESQKSSKMRKESDDSLSHTQTCAPSAEPPSDKGGCEDAQCASSGDFEGDRASSTESTTYADGASQVFDSTEDAQGAQKSPEDAQCASSAKLAPDKASTEGAQTNVIGRGCMSDPDPAADRNNVSLGAVQHKNRVNVPAGMHAVGTPLGTGVRWGGAGLVYVRCGECAHARPQGDGWCLCAIGGQGASGSRGTPQGMGTPRVCADHRLREVAAEDRQNTPPPAPQHENRATGGVVRPEREVIDWVRCSFEEAAAFIAKRPAHMRPGLLCDYGMARGMPEMERVEGLVGELVKAAAQREAIQPTPTPSQPSSVQIGMEATKPAEGTHGRWTVHLRGGGQQELRYTGHRVSHAKAVADARGDGQAW